MPCNSHRGCIVLPVQGHESGWRCPVCEMEERLRVATIAIETLTYQYAEATERAARAEAQVRAQGEIINHLERGVE